MPELAKGAVRHLRMDGPTINLEKSRFKYGSYFMCRATMKFLHIRSFSQTKKDIFMHQFKVMNSNVIVIINR